MPGTSVYDPELRDLIEGAVQSLIAILDEMDDDPDLEPSLGWPDPLTWWRFSSELGGSDDVEEEQHH